MKYKINKHICCYLLGILINILFTSNIIAGVQNTFYVSPEGNDNFPGTIEKPFATVFKAQNVIRKLNKKMHGDIIVYLRGGEYILKSSIQLSNEDSGTNGHKIIYQAYKNEKPIFTGGLRVNNWKLFDKRLNIYRAKIYGLKDTRQLFINGTRATRARSENAIGWIDSKDGYSCPSYVEKWNNISDVEVVYQVAWRSLRGPISSVSNQNAKMSQDYWRNMREISKNTDYQEIKSPVWIENAFELLDIEGEWYFNKKTNYIYYKPRMNEDLQSVEVIIPSLETLLYGEYVSNVIFKGITFSYATWLQPNTSKGFVHVQASILSYEGEQMPGNVTFKYSNNIRFENNTFIHLGATGLRFSTGSKNNYIYNNIFSDISGSAISVGEVNNSKPSHEDLVINNTIDNNLINKVAVEYLGSTGIFIGYTKGTIIKNNEIRNLPYTSISVGWGWNNEIIAGRDNEISYNLIDSGMLILNDGAAIYTLSSQPGTQVFNNFINNQRNGAGGLYLDDGSSNMHWYNNVVLNTDIWLNMWTKTIKNNNIENNFFNTKKQVTNGTNNIIRNNTFVSEYNLPLDAIKIIQNSGRKISP